jgi:hypothetical protein
MIERKPCPYVPVNEELLKRIREADEMDSLEAQIQWLEEKLKERLDFMM